MIVVTAPPGDGGEQVTPADRSRWRRWLEENHDSSDGVWVVYFKKGSGEQGITYDEAVEEALCFGWIDSKVRTIDEKRYRQRFTPRRPGSIWSRLNKQRIEQVIAEGEDDRGGHGQDRGGRLGRVVVEIRLGRRPECPRRSPGRPLRQPRGPRQLRGLHLIDPEGLSLVGGGRRAARDEGAPHHPHRRVGRTGDVTWNRLRGGGIPAKAMGLTDDRRPG